MSSRIAIDSGSGVRTSPNPYIIIATVHAGSEVVGGASGRSAVYVPVERHTPTGSGAQLHSACRAYKSKPHSPSFSKGRLTLLSTSRTNPRCPCGAPRPCAPDGVFAPACRPDPDMSQNIILLYIPKHCFFTDNFNIPTNWSCKNV
jgi:hypothetical protein